MAVLDDVVSFVDNYKNVGVGGAILIALIVTLRKWIACRHEYLIAKHNNQTQIKLLKLKNKHEKKLHISRSESSQLRIDRNP